MAVSSSTLTVDEFSRLREPAGRVRQELHHGEVLWIADVAVSVTATWEDESNEDYLLGVPSIVIEVLSPSNTASEMLDREETCLRNGGREFWLVDPLRQSAKVTCSDGSYTVHDLEGNIESAVLGASIRVRDIFAISPVR
jgi:Uma2 family endonuclease